ncbi:hypothetical protein Peur_005286 [Populus x canadensis]
MTAMVGNADIAYRVRISHRRNIHFSGEMQIDCYGGNGVADVDFSSHVDSEMAGFLLILQIDLPWRWGCGGTCNGGVCH